MSRSDKVPFRREFSMSSDGYVGSDEGFFVGDILSLHLDVNKPSIGFVLQGKVGRDGEWEKIKLESGTTHKADIDVRSFEYIRLEVLNINEETKVTLFGYENNTRIENQLVTLSDKDYKELCQSKFLLEEIRDSLGKLNIYMSIITGEDL